MAEEKKEPSNDDDCYVCIDVECAAIGHGHFDIAPCRIAMCDRDGKKLFHAVTQVRGIKDSLVEYTGLTIQETNKGVPLKNALAKLHALLSCMHSKHKNGVTLIGQSPQNDIIWVELIRHKHYTQIIDLVEMFRTGRHLYSLRKEAYAALGKTMNTSYHDPFEDAQISMELFRTFSNNGAKLRSAKEKLMSIGKKRRFPDFRVKTKFTMCQGKYNPDRCFCLQKTARDVSDVDVLKKLIVQSKPILQMTSEMMDRQLSIQLRELRINSKKYQHKQRQNAYDHGI